MTKYAFPRAIEIQTTSACNAKCVRCPHEHVSKVLPSGIMSMELFAHIIDQIDEDTPCRIIPYLNSEPLLDPHIVERIGYISRRSSLHEIELSTNCSALTPSKQAELTGLGLTDMRLSVFGFTEETHSRLMPGLRWSQIKKNLDHLVGNSALRCTVGSIGLVMIDAPDLPAEDISLADTYCHEHGLIFHLWGFLDRAQNVEKHSNSVYRPVISGCEQNRPLERMHITLMGDVILCCQDWRWQHKLGNVRQQSLIDIWSSLTYQSYRERIYNGGGQQPSLCTHCKLSIPG